MDDKLKIQELYTTTDQSKGIDEETNSGMGKIVEFLSAHTGQDFSLKVVRFIVVLSGV